jgi:hypothetical protein
VYATLYDAATESTWNQSATGSHGVAWIAGITQGTTTLTVASGATSQMVAGVPIGDSALTFLTVELP